jgi:hypothetical protein
MELIKNNRFRTGSVVDIYHTPVYESNTISITDISVGNDWKVNAKFSEDLSIEQFGVGDICALSFGVGEIVSSTNYAGGLGTVSIVSGGTGYAAGENQLSISQSGGTNGIVIFTADPNGTIVSVGSVVMDGSGYSISGNVTITDGLGTGLAISIDSLVSHSEVVLSFPTSMFPDSDVAKYVGNEIQHALFFLTTGRVEANFTVAKYKEEVKQATYGYAKVVYNLQTQADLILTPIRMVDDGTLSKILYSKGFVLKSCNSENYVPTTAWSQDFPIELSGTSIDPIYRRAYLGKRQIESRSRKSKAKLTFRLIG